MDKFLSEADLRFLCVCNVVRANTVAAASISMTS